MFPVDPWPLPLFELLFEAVEEHELPAAKATLCPTSCTAKNTRAAAAIAMAPLTIACLAMVTILFP